MIALGARLSAIYDAVGFCDCIADIGSDHAFLPIALLQTERVKRAIVCDINQRPLNRGRKNAKKYGLDSIEFLISDGFKGLMDKSFDTAAICGMGGALISDIIKKGGSKAHCKLILQPMTAYEQLRAFLWDSGFFIYDEIFAVESKKPYVVICCRYIGEKVEYGYSDLFLGKVRPNTYEFSVFCKKIASQAKKGLKGAVIRGEPTECIERLIEECEILQL